MCKRKRKRSDVKDLPSERQVILNGEVTHDLTNLGESQEGNTVIPTQNLIYIKNSEIEIPEVASSEDDAEKEEESTNDDDLCYIKLMLLSK